MMTLCDTRVLPIPLRISLGAAVPGLQSLECLHAGLRPQRVAGLRRRWAATVKVEAPGAACTGGLELALPTGFEPVF